MMEVRLKPLLTNTEITMKASKCVNTRTFKGHSVIGRIIRANAHIDE